MNKKLLLLTGISVFLGAGYAAWIYTPLGKITLAKWLLKKWEVMANERNKKFAKKLIATELDKLNYDDHILLLKITRYDYLKKRIDDSELSRNHHPLRLQEIRKGISRNRKYLKETREQIEKTKLFERAKIHNPLIGILFDNEELRKQ